jgi:hypothetical protein
MSRNSSTALALVLLAALALAAACGTESDAKGEETNCTDGRDNDFDDHFDCNDPDCASEPVCVREHCYNLVDDDGDGLVDCNDDQCIGRSVCSGAAEDCVNGIDDDSDGLIDCDDDGCARTAACVPDGEDCTNGSDDDGDGDGDCADDDCSGTAVCALRLENCENGTDDDGDTAVDCDDDDCSRTAFCLDDGEICDNGSDDDGDRQVDCDDTDCAYTQECRNLAENCENGIDDDGDGATDCDDAACAQHAACTRLCQNDTDGDGESDCDDDDIDGDGILNGEDNCPVDANPGQEDRDDDDIGDVCGDRDRDGVADAEDNCWLVRNREQRDRDGDGMGNACDDDESLADADLVIETSAGTGLPYPVAFGDVDGDGTRDAVFQIFLEPMLYVFSNPGARGPSTLSIGSADIVQTDPFGDGRAPEVRSGDFNGDGVLDLLLGEEMIGGSFVYVVTGPISSQSDLLAASAVRRVSIPSMDFFASRSFDVGDFDGDGNDDLAVGVSDRNSVDIYSGTQLTEPDPQDLEPEDAQWTLVGPILAMGFGFEVQFLPDFLPVAPGNSSGQEIAVSATGGSQHLYVLESEKLVAGDPVEDATFTRIVDHTNNYRFVADTNRDGLPEVYASNLDCDNGMGTAGGLARLTHSPPPEIVADGFALIYCDTVGSSGLVGEAQFIDVDGDGIPGFITPRQTTTGDNELAYFSNWQNARAALTSPQRTIDASPITSVPAIYPAGDLDANGHADFVVTYTPEAGDAAYIWLSP